MKNHINQIYSRRIDIDTIKAFGIFFVVLGHINSPASQFIFSWHMPFFFFISGFFIDKHLPLSLSLKKYFQRLMIPYFFFGIIGIVAEILKRNMLQRGAINIWDSLIGLFFWMDISSLNHYGFVLWFLPSLLWGKICITCFVKYMKNYYLVLLIIISMVYIVFYSRVIYPFALDTAMISTFWIFLGYIYFNYFLDKKLKYLYMFLIIILLTISYMTFPPVLNIANKSFSYPIWNYIFSSITVIILANAIMNLPIFHQLSIINFWGKNTLWVLFLHPYTNNIAHIIVKKFSYDSMWYIKLLCSLLMIHILLHVKIWISLKFNFTQNLLKKHSE